MRLLCLLAVVVLTGCGQSSSPTESMHQDPTSERWYGQTIDELGALNHQAKDLFERGKSDDAAALIMKGEPLSKKLTSVQQPTLPAVEAASDLDELYGRMLFSNRNYGWARLMYQKNLSRWKYWKPQTAETAERLKRAQSLIAGCDEKISQ